ncbi:MAG: hypothetical protein FJY98_03725 [Candidatus Liptonbacteria bacterium]|nr:hypothetical protein [Candidatus Liptonbacteria bacterium]
MNHFYLGRIAVTAFVVAGAFFLILPSSIFAQTAGLPSDIGALQILLQSLQRQVQELNQRLLKTQPQGGAAFCHVWGKNFGIESSNVGADTKALVRALIAEKIFASSTILTPGTEEYIYTETVAAGVTSFQEKYASEILAPAGLGRGTGYVGAKTRAKLHQLYGCANQPGSQATSSLSSSPGTSSSSRVSSQSPFPGVLYPAAPPAPPESPGVLYLGTSQDTSTSSGNSLGSGGVAPALARDLLAKKAVNETFPAPIGTPNLPLGKFRLENFVGQPVVVNSIAIRIGENASEFQDLQVLVDGQSFGAKYASLQGGESYSFSGVVPVVINHGGAANVVVTATVRSGAVLGGKFAPTTLAGCVASNKVSLQTIGCSPTAGQDVWVMASLPIPELLAIEPASGSVGARLTLRGNNFSRDIAIPTRVLFVGNGLSKMELASGRDGSSVVVAVPAGLTSGAYEIFVDSWAAESSNSKTFIVTAASATSTTQGVTSGGSIFPGVLYPSQ